MTERARLTDALALAARPREREYAVHDIALQGFMLRVQPNGARSWVFRFRRDGKPRRVTLSKPEAVKADQARAAALAFLAREKGGGSPVPPSRFWPDADEVRSGIRRAALALVEAVHGEGDPELPQQRHPARARPSPRRLGRARRYRPHLPRVRTQKAGRRASKS